MLSRIIQAIAPLAVVLLLAGSTLAAQTADDVAQAAAETWLKIVDAGRYAESWDEAATGFKSAVTQEQWTGAASNARGPLGGLTSRTLASRQVTDQPPPGAPAGKYAILRYTSAFANAPAMNEMVVLVLDGDRGWRVGAYTVRP